jgi:DNA-binding FadR family transcriptional regulator
VRGSLGVSRTVVREAVKSLVAKGLLVTGPKVGTRVLPSEQWNWFDPDVVAWQSKIGLTREFLRDLQELRRVVEPAAVRLAAERATAQDIADIEAAYAGMKDAIEQGGDYVHPRPALPPGPAARLPQPHGGPDEQGAGRAAAHQLRDQHLAARRPGQSLPLHRAVLDAVIARNPAKAEKAILVLIDGAARRHRAGAGSRRKLPSVAQPAPRPPELLSVMRAGVARLEALAEDPAGGDAYAETTHRLIQISAHFAGNDRLRRMIAALSLQSLRYSKLGLASVERRRRSVKLWKQAARALERGDTEQMMLLARQRSEESADEAAKRLDGPATPEPLQAASKQPRSPPFCTLPAPLRGSASMKARRRGFL